MPYQYSDSFTGVDGTLLTAHVPDSSVPFAWTKLHAGDLTIFHNRIDGTAAGQASRHRANVDALNHQTGDYEASVDIITAGVAPGSSAAISLVQPGTEDGYRMVLSLNLSSQLSFALSLMTGGGLSGILNSAFLPLPPDGIWPLKITKSGNLITGWWLGVALLQFVDAFYQATSQICIDARSFGADTYVIGSLSAGRFDPNVPFPDPATIITDCAGGTVGVPVITTPADPALPVFTVPGDP